MTALLLPILDTISKAVDAAVEPDSSYPLTLVKVTAVTAVTAGLGGENMAMGHNKQPAKMDGLIG